MQCPPSPGPGYERHEAEGLCPGSLDHLPDVDIHTVEHELHLVGEGDVHRAKDVLEELGRFCNFGGRHGDDLLDRGAVERRRQLLRGRVETSHDLGDVLRVERPVAGVLPLGGEGEKEVGAALEAPGLERGKQLFTGRARIGRRLQDHELTAPEPRRHLRGGRSDEREIGLTVLAEGCRDANQDSVALGKAVEIGRGDHPPAGKGAGHPSRTDVADVRLASLESLRLRRVDVEPHDLEACLFEEQCQRKTDVAQADHADLGVTGTYLAEQLLAWAHEQGDASTTRRSCWRALRASRPRPARPPRPLRPACS